MLLLMLFQLLLMHTTFFTAVSVGFEMIRYFVHEAMTSKIVWLVREDILSSTHGFNITINIAESSNATKGLQTLYNSYATFPLHIFHNL